ncbi:MAG: hypothetical protein HY709_04435, partial [Candidatus Latescibacteria bacterium]|nr:hypothetical protein [Candidatus Latescibacterota bacterium]
LIQTALGGSPLSAWNPVENPDAPLYRNLIHCVTLTGGRVRGVVWYQGESDCSLTLAPTYERRFAEFVGRLRYDLQTPDLPIIIAQLNRYTAPTDVETHRAWSIVREAQRQAVKLGHVAVVSTLDLSISDLIHTSPDGNLILGSRKARAALDTVYGKAIGVWKAPEVTGACLSEDRKAVELSFTNVANRLAFLGPGEGDFVVEDAEGFVPVHEASCPARDQVRLDLERPAAGQVSVHGAFGTNPSSNLRDAEENTPILGFYERIVTPAK